MSYYKKKSKYLGYSDIAQLTIYSTFDNAKGLHKLCFDKSGDYNAYIVYNDDSRIPFYYKKTLEFYQYKRDSNFGDIYILDDSELKMLKFSGKKIEIYQSGKYGCIIRIINKDL